MRSKNNYNVEIGDWLWTNTNPPTPMRVIEVYSDLIRVDHAWCGTDKFYPTEVLLMFCTPGWVWPKHLGPPPLNLGPTSEAHLTVPKVGERKTRLERAALGWLHDPYARHTAKLQREGREMLTRGINTRVKDLGRRYFPAGGGWIENDHAQRPRVMDDPTGDDVAADAPGAAEYLKR